MKVYVYTHERTDFMGRPYAKVYVYTRSQGSTPCIHEIAPDKWHRVCQAAIKEHRAKCLAPANAAP